MIEMRRTPLVPLKVHFGNEKNTEELSSNIYTYPKLTKYAMDCNKNLTIP